jgi:hypothetical protein
LQWLLHLFPVYAYEKREGGRGSTKPNTPRDCLSCVTTICQANYGSIKTTPYLGTGYLNRKDNIGDIILSLFGGFEKLQPQVLFIINAKENWGTIFFANNTGIDNILNIRLWLMSKLVTHKAD